MVELNAGLYHQRDDTGPDGIESLLFKGVTMGFQCRSCGLRRGDSQFGERLMGSARYRHFSANHINQIRLAKMSNAVLFGNLRQARGTFRDDGIGQWHGIALAGHAAIKVDFFESGGDIASDQFVGIGHCRFCGQVLPTIRAEVVAPQNQLLLREIK